MASVVAFGLLSSAALAASPHFKKGGRPVCTVSVSSTSASTTCTATLAGLGNDNLVIMLTVGGSAVYTCRNPGGNEAPGQNKVLVGPVVAPTVIPGEAIKNGTVTFTTNPAVLSADTTVSGTAAGCPGPNWTGVKPKLTVTDITLTIEQGDFSVTCTASDEGGLKGRVSLTCN